MFNEGIINIGTLFIKGKPFEGYYEVLIENKKFNNKLENHHHIIKIIRDSEGRLRRETKIKDRTIIEIIDISLERSYFLDTKTKIAISRNHIINTQATALGNATVLYNIAVRMYPDISSNYLFFDKDLDKVDLNVYQDLGVKNIEGLVCWGIGIREKCIDANGDENTFFQEVWISEDLQEIVSCLFSFGIHNEIHRLSNIRQINHNYDLFSVPEDYQLLPNGTLDLNA